MSRRSPMGRPVQDGDYASADEWFADVQVLREELAGQVDRENIEGVLFTNVIDVDAIYRVFTSEAQGPTNYTVKGRTVIDVLTLEFDTDTSFLEIEGGMSFEILTPQPVQTLTNKDEPVMVGCGLWFDGEWVEQDPVNHVKTRHALQISMVRPVLLGSHTVSLHFYRSQTPVGTAQQDLTIRLLEGNISVVESRR